MKLSEVKKLSKQLVAIMLTLALLVTVAPADIRVAKAAGVRTVQSVTLDSSADPGSYTFYQDFNPEDYVATGSRITVTYQDEDENEYQENYVVDSPSNASPEEGDYNDVVGCYESEAYAVSDEDQTIYIRYYQDQNEVYAFIPDEDYDEEYGEESGQEFFLYQPIYIGLDQMPTISLNAKETIRDSAYAKYYRLDAGMQGMKVDINTEYIDGVKTMNDPILELFEYKPEYGRWIWVNDGSDHDEKTEDYNDRLVHSLKSDAEYIVGVYNMQYYTEEIDRIVLNAELSIQKFIPAKSFSVKLWDDSYRVYPQFGVYPYEYTITDEEDQTTTVYGTGSQVWLKDGMVLNDEKDSSYAGLDGTELNGKISASNLQTVEFPVEGEEYEIGTSITIPAKTQKLMYMCYDGAEDYELLLTNGDENTLVSYVTENMEKVGMYGCSNGGVLDILSSYPGTTCYLLFQNYSDHDATYQLLVDGMTPPSPTPDPGTSTLPSSTPNPNKDIQPTPPTVSPTLVQKPGTGKKASIKGKTVTAKKIKYKAISENTAAVVGTTAAKKLKSVTIPATVKIDGVSCKVTMINAKAFQGCKKLKTVTIGKNVVKIKGKSFAGCKKLQKVTMASGKKVKIAKKSFKGCPKIAFKVKKSLKKAYNKSLKKSKIGCQYTVK